MTNPRHLTDSIKPFAELCAEEEVLVRNFFHEQTIKKGEILLHAGEICRHIFFVESGLLRTFHLNANGTEFTRLIVSEGQFCTVLLSFQEKIPSPATVQALENGKILKISREDFQNFNAQSENAKIIYTKILEDFQNYQIRRIEFLTQLSSQEKVSKFLAESPNLEARLSSKVAASYLQITPETYSRCKKTLKP